MQGATTSTLLGVSKKRAGGRAKSTSFSSSGRAHIVSPGKNVNEDTQEVLDVCRQCENTLNLNGRSNF